LKPSPSSEPERTSRTVHRLFLLVLLVSWVLRIVLVRSGGQYYWPDEFSYEEAQKIFDAIVRGDSGTAFFYLQRAGPVLFKIVAMLPVAIERLTHENPYVPGLFFAAFSVCNICLIARIANALGASEIEALFASTLLAMASSFFYFSRHLLPYDVAMTFALAAMDVGIRSGASLRGSFVAGLFAACALVIYNGYWTIAAAAILVPVLTQSRSVRDGLWRILISAAGGCVIVGLIVLVDGLHGGRLVEDYRSFVDRVTQGSFGEGWRLHFEYLWHAEHGLLVAWLMSLGWCLVTLRRASASPLVRAGLVGLVFVFVALAIGSTLLHRFVVYGRLARQLVPFFCLISAYAFARWWQQPGSVHRGMTVATAAALVVQTAVNFSQSFALVFPADIERRFGPSATSHLTWINVGHIYPAPNKAELPDRYVVVYEAPHPLTFLPYQYEGYTPEQRRVLRSTDISMRLIDPAPGRR
jgi:hypothetical protein